MKVNQFGPDSCSIWAAGQPIFHVQRGEGLFWVASTVVNHHYEDKLHEEVVLLSISGSSVQKTLSLMEVFFDFLPGI